MKKMIVALLSVCLILSCLCLGICAEDAAEATEEAGKTLSTGALVSLIIGGVLLLALIVLCIVKRKKVAEGLRSYRSEMKKITWYSKKQTVRGTVFVIIAVIVTAVVIGLIDYVFFQGQILLINK